MHWQTIMSKIYLMFSWQAFVGDCWGQAEITYKLVHRKFLCYSQRLLKLATSVEKLTRDIRLRKVIWARFWGSHFLCVWIYEYLLCPCSLVLLFEKLLISKNMSLYFVNISRPKTIYVGTHTLQINHVVSLFL